MDYKWVVKEIGQI